MLIILLTPIVNLHIVEVYVLIKHFDSTSIQVSFLIEILYNLTFSIVIHNFRIFPLTESFIVSSNYAIGVIVYFR